MRPSGGSYVCSFENLAWVAGQELNLILSLDACYSGLLYPFELPGHRHVTACRWLNMKRLSLVGKEICELAGVMGSLAATSGHVNGACFSRFPCRGCPGVVDATPGHFRVSFVDLILASSFWWCGRMDLNHQSSPRRFCENPLERAMHARHYVLHSCYGHTFTGHAVNVPGEWEITPLNF